MTKIMIVDDEEFSRYVLKAHLEKEGYQVREAASGEEALQVLKEELPSIIFLDVLMPGISGLEVCRELKTNPATRSIPVIMLSAYDEETHKLQHEQEPVLYDAYLVKPWTPDELQRALAKLPVLSAVRVA